MIRKTAGYWLISLQSEEVPTATFVIEDIAMTRLGLNDWTDQTYPTFGNSWEKTFDNFLADLNLELIKFLGSTHSNFA